jgi:hypothetical protein
MSIARNPTEAASTSPTTTMMPVFSLRLTETSKGAEGRELWELDPDVRGKATIRNNCPYLCVDDQVEAHRASIDDMR